MGQSQSKGTAFQSLDIGRIADPAYVKTQFLKHWRLHSGVDSSSKEPTLHRIGLHSITVCVDRRNEIKMKNEINFGKTQQKLKNLLRQKNSMHNDGHTRK